VNVFAIRDGETSWSLSGQQTAMDIPLTEPGLATKTFGLVLCSLMQRAQETCKIAGLGDKSVIDSDLGEWSYSELRGADAETDLRGGAGLADIPGWCPGNETPEQVSARVDRVIARSHGCWQYRTIRARTRSACARSTQDWTAYRPRSTLSSEYRHSVCARLLT
jgi:probable phosphoglycerate mutase